MAREPIRAVVTFARDGVENKCRARLPAVVRDMFDARPGDKLIIEEGCERTVMLATLRKGNNPYFIITLERAAEPAQESAEQVAQPAAPVADESLAAAVERKLREGKG
jgi:bifunctional DNA-binding transcriptional regulator/antitoxin component of YhaV-PrlF toxin-antitoxin module